VRARQWRGRAEGRGLRRAYTYTMLVVFAWGFSQVANKALLTASRDSAFLTPLQVAFWPVAVGWVALLLVLAGSGRLGQVRHVAPRGWVVLAAMGLFGWVGHSVGRNIALKLLPLPDGIMINYLHPMFVVMFQGALFGAAARRVSGWERPQPVRARPSFILLTSAVSLCLLGVAMIVTEGKLTALASSASFTGALAGVLGAFAWGVYSNLGRFVSMRSGREGEEITDVQSFAAMTVGLFVLAAALAGSGGLHLPSGYRMQLYLGALGPATVPAWPLIALHGVVVYCGGYTLWLYALAAGERAGGGHRLPLLTYLTPLLSISLGWIVLHESFGPGFWQGALLIAAGNVMALWGTGKRRAVIGKDRG